MNWRPAPLGAALVSFGRVHCKLGTLQEEYSTSLEDTYIRKLQDGITAIKEYQVFRKKLESRRYVPQPAIGVHWVK